VTGVGRRARLALPGALISSSPRDKIKIGIFATLPCGDEIRIQWISGGPPCKGSN
jgi:hypothetical protein